jgi:eukaryotic-like serine/threonine-protein kinase
MHEHGEASPFEAEQPPPEIPDFNLIRPIGRGGFGRVWLAANRTTGQLRAVKVIARGQAGRTDPAQREINSLTRLETNLRRLHPNLVTIHHVGKTGEHLFYVMDLADDVTGAKAADGGSYRPATLQSRLESGPLHAHDCLERARQLLAGLASLHAAGMIHRDVKPANCLFIDGELKLADFGLVAEAGHQVSRVGTEKYMPPDGRMDARADIYAAGLVIYEMITGLPPDRFPQLGERTRDLVNDQNLRSLLRIVLRACEPAPERRFADAQEMLAELAALEPDARSAQRVSRRRIVAWSAAAVALAALAAGGAWLLRSPPRVHVNFTTEPFEATIFLDGVEQRDADGIPCRTPCTIENLPARPHQVVFRHESLPDLAREIDFAAAREVFARWKEGK